MNSLEFEQEVVPLEQRIEALRNSTSDVSAKQILSEITGLEKEVKSKLRKIYRNLDGWQTCQVARHMDRPHTLDYVKEIFTDFNELHGDRMFADDRALVGGMARFEGEPVMVIGHQKGHNTEERLTHNFGMPHPEGYRKALRLMRLAEKFSLPLITMIDTPGAYCGIGAEERGQSQAIGANLLALAGLSTQIVAVIIGEGGSGGALAIGVADKVLMFEHSIYSVISPEGCSSILWKAGENNIAKAANAMQLRAKDLQKLNLVDEIISEPVGGAHRKPSEAADSLREALRKTLGSLSKLAAEECIDRRAKRLRDYGVFTEKRR